MDGGSTGLSERACALERAAKREPPLMKRPPAPPSVPLADGCPNLCNGNGQCTMGQQSWHCECQTGWRGPGCSVAMETSCADNKDNEGGELERGGMGGG